jgi:hypothetical protein
VHDLLNARDLEEDQNSTESVLGGAAHIVQGRRDVVPVLQGEFRLDGIVSRVATLPRFLGIVFPGRHRAGNKSQ